MSRFLVLFCSLVVLASGASLPEVETNVVGGTPAKDNQFPFAVSLRHNLRHVCGGAIINSRWVLTIAQCVRGRAASSLSFLVGTRLLNGGGLIYEVLKYVAHERFEPGSKFSDIAVVQTVFYLSFTPSVQPIPMANSSHNNQKALLMGWGYIFNGIGSHSDYLNYVEQTALSSTECILRYSTGFDNVCTIPEISKGYCDGDEGAPLVIDGELVGLFSHTFRTSCGSVAFPDVYTSISYHRTWILATAL